MKLTILFSMAALFTGALIPMQAAANATLSKFIGSVAYSALVLFTLGFGVVVSFILLNRVQMPSFDDFLSAPTYSYIGGVIVATYVLSITFLAPRMGVGNAICFIVTGQIIMAVIIDHFGLLGAATQSLSLSRSMGVVLMVGGLFLARA